MNNTGTNKHAQLVTSLVTADHFNPLLRHTVSEMSKASEVLWSSMDPRVEEPPAEAAGGVGS